MNRRLIQASWNGDVDHLLKELDHNPSTLHSVALEGSETPLHIACFAGQVNFVATVIRLRQEFSMELNQDGFSPLHIAAACGHTEIVKELLKVDFGLCLIQGKDRKIPLHLAVVKGKVDVVRELLLACSDSVECTTCQLETSLHLAVKNNQFEAFKILIQHLLQVNKEDLMNSKDIHGNTVLHLAVSMKQYEVVDFLLNGQVTSKEKVELNALNKSGLTPLDMLLMFQSEAGDREIQEILIQAGALKSENQQTPAYPQEERINHPDTRRHENPRSPAKAMWAYFKYNNLKDTPSIVRNTLLVIVILITNATYQPALSPPGGAWQEDYVPSTGNYTLSPTTNNSTVTKPHTAGKAIMGTENPVAYSIFLFANSMGFYTSVHMIYVLTAAFPLQLELQVLMFAILTTYSTCMIQIATNDYITFGFVGISIALPFGIPWITTLFRNYLTKPRNILPETSQEGV